MLRFQLSTKKVKETNRKWKGELPAILTGSKGMLLVTCKLCFRASPFKPEGWWIWSVEPNSYAARILAGINLRGELHELRDHWNQSIRMFVKDFDRKYRGDAMKKLFIVYARKCHEGSVCHSTNCFNPNIASHFHSQEKCPPMERWPGQGKTWRS